MTSQRAGRLSVDAPLGTQKGDVYSFAIILHEIIYRAGLFHRVYNDEPIPAKSTYCQQGRTSLVLGALTPENM